MYVENGTLRIADSLKLEGQKKIACDYTPIVRGDGDHEIFLGPKIQDTPDGYDLMEDAFHVRSFGVVYTIFIWECSWKREREREREGGSDRQAGRERRGERETASVKERERE